MERATILIVDDSPENLDVLKGLLSTHYQLKAAPNGKVALKIINLVPHPDLILLDIMMPIMDGFEVLTELKKNEETKDIPVIMLTALDSEQNIEKGLKLGAVDYIPKPFEPEKILEKIKENLF
jgi:putative two-component system response regulator